MEKLWTFSAPIKQLASIDWPTAPRGLVPARDALAPPRDGCSVGDPGLARSREWGGAGASRVMCWPPCVPLSVTRVAAQRAAAAAAAAAPRRAPAPPARDGWEGFDAGIVGMPSETTRAG